MGRMVPDVLFGTFPHGLTLLVDTGISLLYIPGILLVCPWFRYPDSGFSFMMDRYRGSVTH